MYVCPVFWWEDIGVALYLMMSPITMTTISNLDYLIYRICYRLCYTRLKLLLVAVTVSIIEQDYSQVLLNPGSDIIIEDDTKGFFICQSEDEVKR